MKQILAFLFCSFSVATTFSQATESFDVSNPTQQALLSVKSVFLRVADSDIDVDSLQLDNQFYEQRQVFGAGELSNIKNALASTLATINNTINPTTAEAADCRPCGVSDNDRLAKLKQMVASIRLDRNSFIANYDRFMESAIGHGGDLARVSSSGPNCNWAFYVCLSLGATTLTTLTAGVGAAASIYICACSFCEYKPTGCR